MGEVLLDVASRCFKSAADLDVGKPNLERVNSPPGQVPESPHLSSSDEKGDDVVQEEWEGKIMEASPDGYIVDWKPSFIPMSYASKEMADAWRTRKAEVLTGKGRVSGSGKKQEHRVSNGVAKQTGSTGLKRRRGRLRPRTLG